MMSRPVTNENRSEEAGGSADAVSKGGSELLEVANVESVDAVASAVPGAAEMERVIDSSANPTMIRAGFYRLAIHFMRESDDFECRQNILRENFPGLGRMNRRSK